MPQPREIRPKEQTHPHLETSLRHSTEQMSEHYDLLRQRELIAAHALYELSTAAPAPRELRPQRQKSTADIPHDQITLTRAHLDAESLFNTTYKGSGGMERMKAAAPAAYTLFKQLNRVKKRGTEEQKAHLQRLRDERQPKLTADIPRDQITLTRAHLDAESLHSTTYKGPGGMERMNRDAPAAYTLFIQLSRVIQNGTNEQKAELKRLRTERKAETRRIKVDIQGKQITPAHYEAYAHYKQELRGGRGAMQRLEQADPAQAQLVREYERMIKEQVATPVQYAAAETTAAETTREERHARRSEHGIRIQDLLNS
ncbi:hypothetical protein [Dictyobacter aurantiacus]|uniref:Uncharacterized protein n=1 Tax=Dictyobacter aurantiacus TaxID=1936993 RepID=A0A401Z9N8_9CHLR|nr:hypothetical protein [Dictyobacter aurantiacus]GCE03516.1 hypothetical protein KDAU_08450 [Dictyobacter aurantiacus]